MVRFGSLYVVTLVIFSINVQFLHAQNLSMLNFGAASKEMPIKILNAKDVKLRSMPLVKTPPVAQKVLIMTKQMTPRQVNCKQENFHLMTECCKETTWPLFKQDTRFKCYANLTLIHALNQIRIYSINRYHDIAINKLNLSSTLLKPLEIKFLECMFRNESLITISNDGSNTTTLNAQKISTYFTDVMDQLTDNSKILIQKATETCISNVPGVVANQPKSEYNILPFVFTQCLMREMFLTCTLNPTGIIKTFADWCAARRNALQVCSIA